MPRYTPTALLLALGSAERFLIGLEQDSVPFPIPTSSRVRVAIVSRDRQANLYQTSTLSSDTGADWADGWIAPLIDLTSIPDEEKDALIGPQFLEVQVTTIAGLHLFWSQNVEVTQAQIPADPLIITESAYLNSTTTFLNSTTQFMNSTS